MANSDSFLILAMFMKRVDYCLRSLQRLGGKRFPKSRELKRMISLDNNPSLFSRSHAVKKGCPMYVSVSQMSCYGDSTEISPLLYDFFVIRRGAHPEHSVVGLVKTARSRN